jgi:hypothetical protein
MMWYVLGALGWVLLLVMLFDRAGCSAAAPC